MVIDATTAPRVLILRRDNIGDLVCTTPLFDALRAQLPRAWLGALVTTYNAGVLAGNPALDEVFVYEKLKHRSGSLLAHVGSRIGQLARLRRQKFDCVLVPAPSPQSLKIARSLKSGRVISAHASVPARQHEVERAFDLGRSLGLSGEPGPLRVFPDLQKKSALKKRLGDGPFVAIHISARRPAQRWPLERYAELAAHLSAQMKVILLWAPGASDNPRHPGGDEAAAAVLRAAESAKVIPVETPDLRTLIAALSLADSVVCPDGGAMHLAAALGKPVVALFGDSRDLADLPLQTVVAACAQLAHPG